MTTFRLSTKTKKLLESSTGLDFKQLAGNTIEKTTAMVPAQNQKKFFKTSNRELPPRGSVYLRMGRILKLSTVKRNLARI